MNGRWAFGAIVAVAVGASVADGGAMAAAHPTSAGKAVESRQAQMKAQGAAFKAIIDQVKKDQPDTQALAQDTAKLEALANDLPSWFPKASGPRAGLKTEAKADIWSDPAGFAGASDRFQVAVSKLNQAAKAGDLQTLKAEVRDVGGACAGCHAKFRQAASS